MWLLNPVDLGSANYTRSDLARSLYASKSVPLAKKCENCCENYMLKEANHLAPCLHTPCSNYV